MLKIHKDYEPFEVAFSDLKQYRGDRFTINGIWVPKDKYDIKFLGKRYNLLFPNVYICSVFRNSHRVCSWAIATTNKIHSLNQLCKTFSFHNNYNMEGSYICMPFSERLDDETINDKARRYALNYMSSSFTPPGYYPSYYNHHRNIRPRMHRSNFKDFDISVKHKVTSRFNQSIKHFSY